MPTETYKGRFAPSPSGPLHLGSLFTALASFLQARQKKGRWFLRIDDIDTDRVKKGATYSILKTLESFSLQWDGDILYQSQQTEAYEEAAEFLQKLALLYPCSCSRKQLAQTSKNGPKIYPGTCRNKEPAKIEPPCALRIKTDNTTLHFTDRFQGPVSQNVALSVGDFVLRRRDNVFAYHLATVIDDDFLGITEVLRGIDLLDSTPRQLYLQQQLGLKTPGFAHIPILTNASGIKLSKQNLAKPVDGENPAKILFTCLELLAQNPPSSLSKANKDELLEWAIENWTPSNLNGIKQLDCSTNAGILISD